MATKHSAPKYLSGDAKKKWEASYDDALEQAKVNLPNDESGQLAAAHKEANKMLAVRAPESAAEIDKLEDWQVVPGSVQTRVIDGAEHRVCVTIDGRKHAHRLKKKSAPAAETAPAK